MAEPKWAKKSDGREVGGEEEGLFGERLLLLLTPSSQRMTVDVITAVFDYSNHAETPRGGSEPRLQLLHHLLLLLLPPPPW